VGGRDESNKRSGEEENVVKICEQWIYFSFPI